MYHEDEGYSSGLIGYEKPFSHTLFGDYETVEGLSSGSKSPLDIDYELARNWDATQLNAYCRVVLLTFRNYVEKGFWRSHSYALYRAFEKIKDSTGDVYKLRDVSSDSYSTDVYKRLSCVVNFANDAAKILSDQPEPPKPIRLRSLEDDGPMKEDFYDHLVDLIFNVICDASAIEGPPDKAWSIHYNSVWGRIFGIVNRGDVWKIIHFKLRRKLYEEIRGMDDFFNYRGAAILGFCLNVMGLKVGDRKGRGKEHYALHKVIIHWTKVNFIRLWEDLPDVANACLIGSITFDEKNRRLIKTYRKGLSRKAPREYLKLDRAKKTNSKL